MPAKAETVLVSLKEAKRFMIQCMEAVGASKPSAEAVGDHLMHADYRGHFSHGMNRLEMYVNDVKKGLCDAKAMPQILTDCPATAWVDGRNAVGAMVGSFCMGTAIKKAKDVGIGWVSVKGSNHFGVAKLYSEQALEHRFLGMCFSNSSPLMVPTRGKEVVLGTNPFSLAAPAENGDSYIFDMATTAVALGKIEIQRRKKQPIPEGWALDENGQVTTDAEVAYKSGRLLPLGGTEFNSGYKGCALAMMVEILCGILSGSQFGPHIRKWGKDLRHADLGQCFVAVDPNRFAPGFEKRLSQLLHHLRNMEPADPQKPVIVSGDEERKHMQLVDKEGGLRYLKQQLETCKTLGRSLGVAPPKHSQS